MAAIGVAEAVVFLKEIESQKIIKARSNAFFTMDRVWRWDEDVAVSGDSIAVPRISQLDVNDVGDDGSVSPQAPIETEVVIQMDQEKEVTFRITDRVLRQTHQKRLISLYSEQAGLALTRQLEKDVLGLQAGASQILTAQANFDEAFVLETVRILDNALAPEVDRFGALRPSQRVALLKLARITQSDTRGGNAGDQITKGRFTRDIHGIEFHVTTLVVSAGGEAKNLIWQREAFAVALQTHIEMMELPKDGWRRTFTARELYGFGESRDDHFVVAPTTAFGGT